MLFWLRIISRRNKTLFRQSSFQMNEFLCSRIKTITFREKNLQVVLLLCCCWEVDVRFCDWWYNQTTLKLRCLWYKFEIWTFFSETKSTAVYIETYDALIQAEAVGLQWIGKGGGDSACVESHISNPVITNLCINCWNTYWIKQADLFMI